MEMDNAAALKGEYGIVTALGKVYPLFARHGRGRPGGSDIVSSIVPEARVGQKSLRGANDQETQQHISYSAEKAAKGNVDAVGFPFLTHPLQPLEETEDARKVSHSSCDTAALPSDSCAQWTPSSTSADASSRSAITTSPGHVPEVIRITDSPMRNPAPTKTFDDFRAERHAKKLGKHNGNRYQGRLPPWPSKGTAHVLPGVDKQRIALQGKMPPILSSLMRQGKSSNDRLEMTKSDIKTLKLKAELLTNQAEFSAILHTRPEPFQPSIIDTREPKTDVMEPIQPSIIDTREPKTDVMEETLRQNCLAGQHSLWMNYYAPNSVEEVLGQVNNANGIFLRSWLSQLSLRGAHVLLCFRTDLTNVSACTEYPKDLEGHLLSVKRSVQREVSTQERKRRKISKERRMKRGGVGRNNDLDNFLASNSDEECEGPDYHDLKAGMSVPDPLTMLAKSSMAYSPSHLTNAILLCGPLGCGKTSTIYAVAREMNWHIFEFYPGIGKRGLKDIEKYVGVVGNNHIVTKSDSGLGGRKLAHRKAEVGAASDIETYLNTHFGRVNGHQSRRSEIEQSLILIEEVDILFPSDHGFWEGWRNYLH